MVGDPDLIHYSCIANGTIILAEFNAKDAALSAIAAKCLEETPPFHAVYTHTVRSKTYTFLMSGPFVYFGIFDEKLEKSNGLAFLNSVKDAFCGVCGVEKNMENMSSHCFQGELYPVLCELASRLDHMETLENTLDHGFDQNGDFLQSGLSRIVGKAKPYGEKGLRKMKNRLLGIFNIGRKNVERGEDEPKALNSEYLHKNGGLFPGELLGHRTANHIWKKQVWVILSLDLFICVILFAIWLWICDGFKCLDS